MTSPISLLLQPILRCWARRTNPDLRGSGTVPGLGVKAVVRWDPFGVPHVVAASEHDLFVTQGYLHARERLWQMDLNRRFFSGRLAEVFGDRRLPFQEFSSHLKGKTTADVDYFVRLLGIGRTANASLGLLPERVQRALEAYSRGVNQYTESITTHRGRRPLEFRLLRYDPDPWKPEDCLTVTKGFALWLSTALLTRLTFISLGDRFRDEEEKFRSLVPRYPSWGSPITRFDAGHAAETANAVLRFVNGAFGDSSWTASGHGSNNWVLGPQHAAGGTPILCNDPHLRMTAPCVWYLNHLRTQSKGGGTDGFTAWGASLPGAPYVYIGHNRHVAWGVTAALCDDGDLFYERTHPEKPDWYRVNGAWEKMELRREVISVRGARAVEKQVRLTRHGPVISDFVPIASGPPSTAAPEGSEDKVIAFQWTANIPGDELRGQDELNRACNWEDFLASLSHHLAPSLNYVYADVSGNIGYTLAGRIPVRQFPPTWLPLPGWESTFDWKGYIPFSELPRLYNPPEGIIATANNRITDTGYSYYLSDLYEPPYRIERIKELLRRKPQLSVSDMASIQMDTVSVQFAKIKKTLKPDLEKIAAEDASLQDCVHLFVSWDGDCSAESPGAALFHVFYRRLMVNLLDSELGEALFTVYAEIMNQAVSPVDQIMSDPGSVWFAGRSRKELVAQCLCEAREQLTRQFGRDPHSWSWGGLHTLTLSHPLGTIGPLSDFFCTGPFPAGGDGMTINNGYYRHTRPYQQIIGPSLRLIVRLDRPIQSSAIIAPGQSGHPISPHYRDQMDLWRQGEYIHLTCSEEEMHEWPTMVLNP